MKRGLKFLGILLIALGIVTVFSQRIYSPTGAIIDVSSVPGLSVFIAGLSLLIAGVISLTTATRIRPVTGLDNLLREVRPKNLSMVVDTSALIQFENAGKLDHLLSVYHSEGKGHIYITPGVVKEVENYKDLGKADARLIEHLEAKTNKRDLVKMNEYAKKVMPYLKLTEKARTFYEFHPMFEEVADQLSSHKKLKPEVVWEIARDRYREKIDNMDEKLNTLFSHLGLGNGKELTSAVSFIKHQLEAHYQPNWTDAEVLGEAFHRALKENKVLRNKGELRGRQKGKEILVLSNDSDLQDAIELMKTGYKGIDPETGKAINLRQYKNIASHIIYTEPERSLKKYTPKVWTPIREKTPVESSLG